MTERERTKKARDFGQRAIASIAATQRLVFLAEIPADEIVDMLAMYDEWEPGQPVVSGDIRRHNGQLYQVIKGKGHTTQADWAPDVTQSLWNKYTPKTTPGGAEVVAPWEQRFGHNQYQPGDKVSWEGKIYECVSVTTYSPTDYAKAWKLIS